MIHPRHLRRAVLPGLVLAAILLPFFWFGDHVEVWSAALLANTSDGAIMLAALALLAGDVLLPVPSSLVSLAAGGALGMAPAAATIWVGMTLSCLVGWGTGRAFFAPVERALAVQAERRADWGVWSLMLCRPVPVLAEMSVLVAAVRGMRLWVLMLACGISSLPVALLYAYFGAAALGDVPLGYLLGAVAFVASAGLIPRLDCFQSMR